MKTNLNDVFMFVAVVDAGSFVGGASSLGLTRSAAGKAVSRLEDRLGVRLINRTTRALSLTDEGRSFYAGGQRAVAAIKEAEEYTGSFGGLPRGLLRLSAPDSLRPVLLPILRKYFDDWPEVQLEASFTDQPTLSRRASISQSE